MEHCMTKVLLAGICEVSKQIPPAAKRGMKHTGVRIYAGEISIGVVLKRLEDPLSPPVALDPRVLIKAKNVAERSQLIQDLAQSCSDALEEIMKEDLEGFLRHPCTDEKCFLRRFFPKVEHCCHRVDCPHHELHRPSPIKSVVDGMNREDWGEEGHVMSREEIDDLMLEVGAGDASDATSHMSSILNRLSAVVVLENASSLMSQCLLSPTEVAAPHLFCSSSVAYEAKPFEKKVPEIFQDVVGSKTNWVCPAITVMKELPPPKDEPRTFKLTRSEMDVRKFILCVARIFGLDQIFCDMAWAAVMSFVEGGPHLLVAPTGRIAWAGAAPSGEHRGPAATDQKGFDVELIDQTEALCVAVAESGRGASAQGFLAEPDQVEEWASQWWSKLQPMICGPSGAVSVSSSFAASSLDTVNEVLDCGVVNQLAEDARETRRDDEAVEEMQARYEADEDEYYKGVEKAVELHMGEEEARRSREWDDWAVFDEKHNKPPQNHRKRLFVHVNMGVTNGGTGVERRWKVPVLPGQQIHIGIQQESESDVETIPASMEAPGSEPGKAHGGAEQTRQVDLDVTVPLSFPAFQEVYERWKAGTESEEAILSRYGPATLDMMQTQLLVASTDEPGRQDRGQPNGEMLAATLLDAILDESNGAVLEEASQVGLEGVKPAMGADELGMQGVTGECKGDEQAEGKVDGEHSTETQG
ncbi:Myo7b [Symbiodinium sp. CCMP2592]|nr:Myo7b [Symbiodinium sp. CCMP2592]